VPLGDIIYTRLSAQIYLQRSDFRRLGELVLKLIGEISEQDLEDPVTRLIHAPAAASASPVRHAS